MSVAAERKASALSAMQLKASFLYPDARLPYSVTVEQIATAVNDFYSMFHDINSYVVQRGYGRLETLMREATFSDFVGESLTRALAKTCPNLKRNRWNNGFPDLLSRADNAEDAHPRGVGIEVKASRTSGQWQAHNRETGWFLVFRFVADTRTEDPTQASPFEIVEILAAELTLQDWSVSRGAEGDQIANIPNDVAPVEDLLDATTEAPLAQAELPVKRRTRTTSTNASGTYKLRSNPIYAHPAYVVRQKNNPLWQRVREQQSREG